MQPVPLLLIPGKTAVILFKSDARIVASLGLLGNILGVRLGGGNREPQSKR